MCQLGVARIRHDGRHEPLRGGGRRHRNPGEKAAQPSREPPRIEHAPDQISFSQAGREEVLPRRLILQWTISVARVVGLDARLQKAFHVTVSCHARPVENEAERERRLRMLSHPDRMGQFR